MILGKEQSTMRDGMIWNLIGCVSAINGLACFALGSTYKMSFGKLGFVGFLLYLLISSAISYLIVRGKRIRVHEKVQGFVAALNFVVICFMSVVLDNPVAGKSDALSIISYGSFGLMSLSMSRKFELGFETGFSTFFLQLFAAELFKINTILSLIALVFCSLFIILRHSSESNEVQSGSAINPNGYHPPDAAVIDIREESQYAIRMGEVSRQSLLSKNNQQKNQEESSQAMHHSASNGRVPEGSISEDSDDQQNREGEEDRSSLPAESRDQPKTELRRRRPISTWIENMSSSVADPHAMAEEASMRAQSFMEESTKVSDLSEYEKRALRDLKVLVQQALANHLFSGEKTKDDKAESFSQVASDAPRDEPTEPTKTEEETTAKTEPAHVVAQVDNETETMEAINESSVPTSVPKAKDGVSIWGIPLLADERSDVILLKFLRARDLKVKEAFEMIKNTIRWRREFGVEELVNGKNLGDDDLEKVVYMHGFDKAEHPVCYNIYGEFQNKELYKKTFSDEEKRDKFLRWRIQFLEKTIRKLDFTPGGISTIVQVNDLKDAPVPRKRDLGRTIRQALQLLQDNYPEFVAKQVFINVPVRYAAFNKMISCYLTQRTKSKFVFAGTSKSAETLLRYIAAEHLPVKHGGLGRDGEFGNTHAVTEITVRPASKHTVEFPVTEKCHVCWEVRVIGWDNGSYLAKFVPSHKGSRKVIIHRTREIASSSEEPVICDSFKTGEPGKVVLTIGNPSFTEKKLLYHFKSQQLPSD